MASLRARLVYDVLMPLLRGKRRYDASMSVEALRDAARLPAPPPKKPGPVLITESRCRDVTVYRLRPRAGVPRHRVFYLHGGAFVNPITRYHWNFLTWLCVHLDAEILVPLYPLAPNTGIADMLPVIEAIHDELTADATFSLAGDSAGAYLALGLAQRLRDRDALRAPAVVLISPCLDLTLGDPRSLAIDPGDPMLDLAAIRQVLSLAALPRAADDPALNPLQGGLAGLPPVFALAGSRDIVYPDTGHLAEAVTQAGGDIEVLDGPGMAHVWPLLPVPEARGARRAIADFIQRHDSALPRRAGASP